MLIPFPFALWFFSLVADVIYFLSGATVWETVAFYTLAGGIVGAVMAAVPGIIDYFSRHSPHNKNEVVNCLNPYDRCSVLLAQ